MKKPRNFLFNKYLLTFLAFLMLMLFFDQNDWFTQRARQRNLNKVNENISFLNAEVEKMETQLKELNTNPLALEIYAREKYFQKKDNEDIYIIKVDSSIVENNK